MSKVKCSYCGKSIDKDGARKTVEGKHNIFFCNEDELNLWLQERNKEADFLEEVNFLFDLYITIREDSCYLDIRQAISTLRKTYTREEILWYLNNTLEDAVRITERKTYEREFFKIRYLLAIIKSNVAEYLRDHPAPLPADAQTEVDYYMAPIFRYKPSKKRRAMSIIEQLEGDDGDG